jgi:hypothetical protein
MGRLWCAAVPRVAVGPAAGPKRVTFVYPFYANPEFLRVQVEKWHRYPRELREYVSALVVDDGSPVPAALPPARPFPMRLFRIEEDVRWNWLAARNIGAYYASGWMLMTDMDHVVPCETLAHLIHGAHDERGAYAFERQASSGEPLTPHSASFFLTRELFWKVGGYDETLSGHYGTDGDWRRRLGAVAPIAILPVPLVRHEYESDASTTAYLRKQPQDARVRTLIQARRPGWTPKTLSFPFHEVMP